MSAMLAFLRNWQKQKFQEKKVKPDLEALKIAGLMELKSAEPSLTTVLDSATGRNSL
jgi:hypothetical protein